MLQSTDQTAVPASPSFNPEPPTTAPKLSEITTVPEPGVETLDQVVRSGLSEELCGVFESDDPVAELDSVVQSVADDLLHQRGTEFEAVPLTSEGEIGSAIQTLVNVALEMKDPVSALEEGAESLAEALADRDAAIRDWHQMAEERLLDEQAAYRHARFHRVSELMDVGYTLDQAAAMTDADEAEVRARAVEIRWSRSMSMRC